MKELKLIQLINRMKSYSDNGYECYISGMGNGDIDIIIKEDFYTII